MDLATEQNNSKKLYDYLCQKIGTTDIVKERRTYLASTEYVSEFCEKTFIASGSTAEGLNMTGSDVDKMTLDNSIEVFEGIPTLAKPNTFVMCAVDTMPGYTYLKLYCKLVSHWVNMALIKRGKDVFLSSKRVRTTLLSANLLNVTKTTTHGPCVSDSFGERDLDYCVQCKSWPRQADVWKTRSRVWPSSNQVKIITRYGVFLVPMGIKRSANEELEWRISFSVAEQQLINSFTHTQFLCYVLLKVTLKEIIEKNTLLNGLLCSFFVKTVIFWVSEGIPQSEWRPDNLFTCFKLCLKQLIYFVQYLMLPHFFIDDINLFTNRFDNFKQLNLIEILYDMYRNNFQWFTYSKTMMDFQSFDVSCYLAVSDIDVCCEKINNLLQMKVLHSGAKVLCSHRFACVFNVRNHKQDKALLWFLFYTECQRYGLSLNHDCFAKKHLLFEEIKHGKDIKKGYKRNKEILAYIILGLRTDAVSGWLYLASYFNKYGAYGNVLFIIKHALSKCNPDKLYSVEDKIYPASLKTVEVEGYQRKLLNHYDIYARHVIHKILFFRHHTLVPDELKHILKDFSFLEMSPVVYAQFLSFLCFYHLRDFESCKSTLHDIRLTVLERYFIPSFFQLISSLKILELGCNMLGYCKLAMYYRLICEEILSKQNN